MEDGLPGKPLTNTVVFRCDASPEIGTGHVMRCMTLANAIKKPYKIIFLCSEETPKSVPALLESDFQILHENSVKHADWLIVDHYDLDKDYEKTARKWARNILVIDDLANRQHDCDVLLDQTYARQGADYKSLVPSHCKLLIGTDFALLKPEFAKLRSRISRNYEQPKNILVSFGGINPKRTTEFTLEMLQGFNEWPLKIDVVTGAHANTLEDIQALCRKLNDEGPHSVELFINTPEMPCLMAHADICIGAGGTTSWERCCLKLPSMTLELADNQKAILRNLEQAGAIYNIGKIEALELRDFLIQFTSLIKDPASLRVMSDVAASICDGSGVKRVVETIK